MIGQQWHVERVTMKKRSLRELPENLNQSYEHKIKRTNRRGVKRQVERG